jgi:hypothetical protein
MTNADPVLLMAAARGFQWICASVSDTAGKLDRIYVDEGYGWRQ